MPGRSTRWALLGALFGWVACSRAATPPPPPARDAPAPAEAPTQTSLPPSREACQGCELAHGRCERGLRCGAAASAGYAEICTEACDLTCCAALPEKYPPPGACGECERQGERCVCAHRCPRPGHAVGTAICYEDAEMSCCGS